MPITLAAFLMAACVLVVPSVEAALLQGGDTYEQGSDVLLEDDAYLGARTVTLRGTTTGDVIAAGSSVELLGVVEQDVFALGGTILSRGHIAGDARLIGGEVYLAGSVEEDAVVVGGTVELTDGARIEHDLIVLADRLVIRGTIAGSVTAYARSVEVHGHVEGGAQLYVRESLTVRDGAFIGGDLVYSAPRAAFITDDASIAGDTRFTRRDVSGPTTAEASVASFLLRAVIVLVGAFALLYFAPRFAAYATLTGFSRSGAVLAWGFVALVLTPILAVLLMVFVLGLLPGIALLGGYAALFVIAKALTPIFAGALLASWLKRNDALTYHLTAVGGLLLIALSFVPFLGWFMNTILLILGFGVVVVGSYEHLWPLRKAAPTETYEAPSGTPSEPGSK